MRRRTEGLPVGAEEHSFPDAEALSVFAAAWSRRLEVGDVVLLSGELGAGKTFFAGCVYRALGGEQRCFSSPTYTLVNVYPLGKLQFYHVDLYRLRGVAEADEIDQERWLDPQGGVAFIEWAERLGGWTPRRGWRVEIFHEAVGRRVRIERVNNP